MFEFFRCFRDFHSKSDKHKKKSGTPTSTAAPKQISCRRVRPNSTLDLTLVRSLGIVTYAIIVTSGEKKNAFPCRKTFSEDLGQHRTMGAAGFGGSFAPIVQYEKWEIHPVFPHFPYFRSGQNLSPNLLAPLCGVALVLFF